jgi:hypothetical protein
MMPFVFFDIHVEQIERLLKKRKRMVDSFACQRMTLASVENRLLHHIYALFSALNSKLLDKNTEHQLSDIHTDLVSLFGFLPNPEQANQWVFEKLSSQEFDLDLLIGELSLIPEIAVQLPLEQWLTELPNLRPAIWRIASLTGKELPLETIERSVQSGSTNERAAALEYSVYSPQLSSQWFEHYYKAFALEPAASEELGLSLKGAFLRGDKEAVEKSIELVSNRRVYSGYFSLLRILALSGDSRSTPILESYCQTDPKRGPWLLTLLGTPCAIESLINMMTQPEAATNSVFAWGWLTNHLLPFRNLKSSVTSVSSNPVQLPFEANQQSAKLWWYQNKASWPNSERMWQGKVCNIKLLQQQLSIYSGEIAKDLWDLYLVYGGKPDFNKNLLRLSFNTAPTFRLKPNKDLAA